jgi:hypothetical protein
MPWNPSPISIVYPVAVFEIMEKGRTQPLGMRCDSGGDEQDFIVKLWNNVELGTHSLAREIYGSMLADFFTLKTPKIAVVDIDADFSTNQPDPKIRQFLMKSPGMNFGSRYMSDALPFNPPAPAGLLSVAIRIFCFDMLIGNVDRRHPKINLFKTADDFILYDHEQAFPFSRPLMMLGGYPPIWDFIKEPWSRDHILYPSLKGKPLALEIDGFISDLVTLEDDIFATIEAQIPSEWQTDLTNISSYIINARDNPDRFKRSLQELLA